MRSRLIKILRIPAGQRCISEFMKIGVLGSGNVGKTLAAGLLKHGHHAMLGTRDPRKPEVEQWLQSTPGATAGTFEQAARFGELVVLATLGRAAEEAISLAGIDNLSGKTVMDTTNPIAETPPAGGILSYFTGPNESLGERIQALAHKAHVVALSFSMAYPLRQIGEALATLRRQLPPGVALWAGGEITRRLRKSLPGVQLIAEIGDTLVALKNWRAEPGSGGSR